jgi:hypothetical protein
MAQRSLHVITKVYYMSMSRFAIVSPLNATLAVLRFPHQMSPSKYVTKYDIDPHSTEQDTLPIVFLISKQVTPYQTRGGTCYRKVSAPKIQSLVDSSTTRHDNINHLHHSIILLKPHPQSSHGHLTSRWMEDHNTLRKTQAIPDFTKDGRLV